MKRGLLILFMIFLGGCSQEVIVDEPVGCPEDAKVCPDGSTVVREGLRCEFAECPIVKMSLEEAVEIAKASDCITKGALTEEIMYNENTYTWWINLDAEKEDIGPLSCNPTCVVSEKTMESEVNWRCTGGKPPEEKNCVDNCGDGMCAEVVCTAIGCPCAETIKSCPVDCNVTQI